MTKRSRCGHALTDSFGEYRSAPSTVYLRTANGSGIDLLPYNNAAALLEQVTATPLFDVVGDLASGFAWPVPGAHPRRSYTVVPLAAPTWPNTPHPAAVTIELWWPPDQDGNRHVRSFLVWADDPYNAYLIACCLWSTADTGAGAVTAFLYGPDRSIAYQIHTAAWTCSHISAETIARVVATIDDHYTTDPLPDDPRTSAMRTERVDGKLTFTGTREEISACLWEHADDREASMDASTALAMRNAAEHIENGSATEYLGMSHYRVAEDCGNEIGTS